ncbi:MAG: DinB family protein [Candidatus Angelobacter sp.]
MRIGTQNKDRHKAPSMQMRSLCHRPSQAANIISMITSIIGRPETTEAAPYYFGYINRVTGDDILRTLQRQLDETLPFLRGITEEKSLYRYAPEKWSIRQMWGHVNDTERVFLMRALWFARNFDTAQPSFDQDIAVAAAGSDDVPWARHVEEFREIRLATISFFRNLPEEAWRRTGVASGNPFTVRACAYIVAGHVTHHAAVLREKYL